MLYGALISVEPFLLLSSTDYKRQWKKQQSLLNQANATTREALVVERLRPMLPFREERMLLTLSFMLCAAVGFAVLLLGGFHIYLTLTAQTTIEFHGNWHNRRRAKALGQKWKNPYSLGYARNWQQVFGSQSIWRALLASARQPDSLPAPVPGHPGRRAARMQRLQEEEAATGLLLMEHGVDGDVIS